MDEALSTKTPEQSQGPKQPSEWDSLSKVNFAGAKPESSIGEMQKPLANTEIANRFKESLERGETFTMTKADLDLVDLRHENDDRTKEINSASDMVMVHVTDYLPEGRIKTQKETGKSDISTVQWNINGQEVSHDIELHLFRDTAHFTLNGTVDSHTAGNWEDCRYAVLLPLDSHKDNVVAGQECDIFTEGGVDLTPPAYLLCPQNEVEDVKAKNPDVNVVAYEADNGVGDFANTFLSQVLDYKYKTPTQSSRVWDLGEEQKYYTREETDHAKAVKIFKENNWEYTSHSGSEWDKSELRQQCEEAFSKVATLMERDGLCNTIEGKHQAVQTLKNTLESVDMRRQYSFNEELSSGFENFKAIDDEIAQESGYTIGKLKNGEDVTAENYDAFLKESEGDPAKRASENVAKEMRIGYLKNQEVSGSLTEAETSEILCEKYLGDYDTLTENKLYDDSMAEVLKSYVNIRDMRVQDLDESGKRALTTYMSIREKIAKNTAQKNKISLNNMNMYKFNPADNAYDYAKKYFDALLPN